jgi:hypothetical protein
VHGRKMNLTADGYEPVWQGGLTAVNDMLLSTV